MHDPFLREVRGSWECREGISGKTRGKVGEVGRSWTFCAISSHLNFYSVGKVALPIEVLAIVQ